MHPPCDLLAFVLLVSLFDTLPLLAGGHAAVRAVQGALQEQALALAAVQGEEGAA